MKKTAFMQRRTYHNYVIERFKRAITVIKVWS